MPGRWPPTTIERGSGDPERIARGLYPYVRGQRLGRLHEFVPSSRLNPSSPATFPWTSMIRRALSSSFSRRVFSRSSLRTFPSSGFRSLGFRPRLFDSALSHPLRYRLAPCRQDATSTSPRVFGRSRPTSRAGSVDAGRRLLRRPVSLGTTELNRFGASAYLPPPRPEQLPRFGIYPRKGLSVRKAIPFSAHTWLLGSCSASLGFSAFALL